MGYSQIALKTSNNLEGVIPIENAVDNKIEKVEIQFFADTYKKPVKIKEACDNLMKMAKENGFTVNEITIHPDLSFCFLEEFLIAAEKIVNQMIYECHIVSETYGIRVNLLFHTKCGTTQIVDTLAESLKNIAKVIQNYNVNILLENGIFSEETFPANVILLAKAVNDNHIKACIDTTHVKARANMYRKDNDVYMKQYLGTENGEYVQQIHFAQALNHDGYIDKYTHGRRHESYGTLKNDVDILKLCGFGNCVYVTEVAEENYNTREQQTEEIKWLAKALEPQVERE